MVLSAKKAENPNRATSRWWPIAQARNSHRTTATPPETSLKVSRLATWCNCAAVIPGSRANAARTRPAVTATVTTAATSASAPRHISRTAPRTARGGRAVRRSRIRSPPRIRAADSASPIRRWPSRAVASSTPRISCSLSCRNALG